MLLHCSLKIIIFRIVLIAPGRGRHLPIEVRGGGLERAPFGGVYITIYRSHFVRSHFVRSQVVRSHFGRALRRMVGKKSSLVEEDLQVLKSTTV